MMSVAEMIGMDAEMLAGMARHLLAEGDPAEARIAALLAGVSGGPCPFVEPDLVKAWTDAADLRVGPRIARTVGARSGQAVRWRPKPSPNRCARSQPTDCEPGLDL